MTNTNINITIGDWGITSQFITPVKPKDYCMFHIPCHSIQHTPCGCIGYKCSKCYVSAPDEIIALFQLIRW